MKKCETCEPLGAGACRVAIGKNHRAISNTQQALGVSLIYLPILTLPFVILSAYISYWHLRAMGAENIKPLKDFLPDRKSFRYTLSNQIVMEPGYKLSPSQSKLFWILNCTWYCPFSVGLFEWHAYLVKLVENWWCPFRHERKDTNYREGAIDRSFWHIYPQDAVKLDPEDRDNPIWNAGIEEDAAGH